MTGANTDFDLATVALLEREAVLRRLGSGRVQVLAELRVGVKTGPVVDVYLLRLR